MNNQCVVWCSGTSRREPERTHRCAGPSDADSAQPYPSAYDVRFVPQVEWKEEYPYSLYTRMSVETDDGTTRSVLNDFIMDFEP